MVIVERNNPTISTGIGMGGAISCPAMARVRLRKELERSIRAGHPWIYADALDAPKGLQTGSVVEVAGRDGKVLARGLYDARSPIAVRVATLDPGEEVDAAFVRRRVESALRARRGVFDARETDAF